MSDNMRPYVVHQGDHLDRIAFQQEFDPEEVWNHQANEELRARRGNPGQLFPGDVIYIPTAPPPGLPLSAGVENRFHATIPTVPVTLVFEEAGEPLMNEACEVRGMPGTSTDVPRSQQTGPRGQLEFDVPVLLREVEVFFPRLNIAYQVRVGDMDPEDELSGIKKRLRNLGYLSLRPELQDDEGALLPSALRAFQTATGLPPSGQIDDATREALVTQHGGEPR